MTSCGHGVTPWACTPWSPAKTATAAGSGSGGGQAPASPARRTDRSSSAPSEPAGLVSRACSVAGRGHRRRRRRGRIAAIVVSSGHCRSIDHRRRQHRSTNASVVAVSRTATRSQSGPSPGNVSPRRTAQPRLAQRRRDLVGAGAGAPATNALAGAPATRDARQRRAGRHQVRRVGGQLGGDLALGGHRPAAAQAVGRGQRGRRDGPQRLRRRPARPTQVRRGRAGSRSAARPAPRSWSGCAAPPGRAGRARPARDSGSPARRARRWCRRTPRRPPAPGRAGPARRSPRPGAAPRSGWWGCRRTPGRRRRAPGPGRAGSRPLGAAAPARPRCPACAQRGLRLGELRVHHDRAARPAQRLGEQHEAPAAAPAVSSTSSPGRGRAGRRPPRSPRPASG